MATNPFCSFCHMETLQLFHQPQGLLCMACCRLSQNELWMVSLLVRSVHFAGFAGYAQLFHDGLLKERLLTISNELKRDDDLAARYLARMSITPSS